MTTTEVRLCRCAFLFVILISFAALLAPLASSDENTQPSTRHEKPYALLFGTVMDKQNHAVYGVKVRIRRAQHKKPQWELVSDHSGEFAQRVPAGKADYVISAETKGRGPRPEVTVHVANDERVDFILHLTQ